jgi:hypothetical protein
MILEKELRNMVRDIVKHALERNGVAPKAELIREVMAHLQSTDSEFAVSMTRFAAASMIRHEMKEYDPVTGTESPQLVLPGCQRVQRAYLIKRNKTPTLVRTDLLSYEEGLLKVAELRAYAAGALAHADELEAYLKARRQMHATS